MYRKNVTGYSRNSTSLMVFIHGCKRIVTFTGGNRIGRMKKDER
jgi:hypothetical protein